MKEDAVFARSFATIMVIVILLFMIMLYSAGEMAARKEAVRNNAAHYDSDENGLPVFAWGPKK